MSVNIDRALTIPGWSSNTELTWLAERASESKTVAEIGSWRGRSARAMADNTTGTVFCIDTFADHAIGIQGWWSTTDDPKLTHWPDWLWAEFTKNTQGCANIIPRRMTSMQAAQEAQEHRARFDLIFIDADHGYQSVKEDILAWRPLLAEGGVLCGHDFGHPQCPDVAVAVTQFIPKFYLHDTIWIAK
jgi:predicted O-methyltransferase YrrM